MELPKRSTLYPRVPRGRMVGEGTMMEWGRYWEFVVLVAKREREF